MTFIREHAMRRVLRGYAKDKEGNDILIGTMRLQGNVRTKDIWSGKVQQSLREKQWVNASHFEWRMAFPETLSSAQTRCCLGPDSHLGDPLANFAVSIRHVLRFSDWQERGQINYYVSPI